MKKNILRLSVVALLLTVGLASLSSCKKKKDDDKAAEVFPADRFVGTWHVAENQTGDTAMEHFTCVLSKVDNDNVKLTTTRTSPPPYDLNGYSVTVNWDAKTMAKSGTTVKGTIKNENDFELHYLFGAGSGVYSIEQHYTR